MMTRTFTAKLDAGHDFTKVVLVTLEEDYVKALNAAQEAMRQMGFTPHQYDMECSIENS